MGLLAALLILLCGLLRAPRLSHAQAAPDFTTRHLEVHAIGVEFVRWADPRGRVASAQDSTDFSIPGMLLFEDSYLRGMEPGEPAPRKFQLDVAPALHGTYRLVARAPTGRTFAAITLPNGHAGGWQGAIDVSAVGLVQWDIRVPRRGSGLRVFVKALRDSVAR